MSRPAPRAGRPRSSAAGRLTGRLQPGGFSSWFPQLVSRRATQAMGGQRRADSPPAYGGGSAVQPGWSADQESFTLPRLSSGCMTDLKPEQIIALLVPIIVIQLGLMIAALVDLERSERRVRGGSKLVWALVIVFVNIVGPILYFVAGREEA